MPSEATPETGRHPGGRADNFDVGKTLGVGFLAQRSGGGRGVSLADGFADVLKNHMGHGIEGRIA